MEIGFFVLACSIIDGAWTKAWFSLESSGCESSLDVDEEDSVGVDLGGFIEGEVPSGGVKIGGVVTFGVSSGAGGVVTFGVSPVVGKNSVGGGVTLSGLAYLITPPFWCSGLL